MQKDGVPKRYPNWEKRLLLKRARPLRFLRSQSTRAEKDRLNKKRVEQNSKRRDEINKRQRERYANNRVAEWAKIKAGRLRRKERKEREKLPRGVVKAADQYRRGDISFDTLYRRVLQHIARTDEIIQGSVQK